MIFQILVSITVTVSRLHNAMQCITVSVSDVKVLILMVSAHVSS